MWFSTGVGPQLGSLPAVTNEMQTSEIESCGGSVQERVQHFSTAFWLGIFSESLSFKGRLLGMDDVFRLITKKAMLEANRPCECLQHVRHIALPAAELGEEVAPG